MGSGTSTDASTARIPQPPSGKGGAARPKKHKQEKLGEPATPLPGSAKVSSRDLQGLGTTPSEHNAQDAPTPATSAPVKSAMLQTPTTSGAGANYTALLHQHQQMQQGLGGAAVGNPLLSGAAPTGASAQQSQPTNEEIDLTSKKVNFRQVIKRALELAQEQRQRYGKFRKDEKRAVMELYECLGLDEDTFLAPPNELQKRILNYRFPPPNMHMLKDIATIDEESLQYVLGPEEARMRKAEGLEVAPAAVKRGGFDADTGLRRVAVSSEGTQAMLKSSPMFKSIPKNKAQGDRLWHAIKTCALFQSLDSSDMKILFDAFEMEKFDANTSIFDQGDEGDKFYLIDSGRCHVTVHDSSGKEVHSLYLGEGETFGELAIMYGTPRAATVCAVMETVCWWIDRDTYRGTLLKETLRKRDKYIKFLETVPLFQNVDSYEKARIADVLEVQEVHGKGTVIIREGEPGDTFFLIEEGEVKFETVRDGEVFERRKAGSFFGEMALIFDRPRMASVIATTPTVKLLTLNRSNFTSYLGPLDEILRRNAEQYKHYVAKAQSSSH